MAKTIYNCAGLKISSEVALPAAEDLGPVDLEFSEGDRRPLSRQPPDGHVLVERAFGGRRYYTFARQDDRVTARFFGFADFCIDQQARQVTSHADLTANSTLLPIVLTGTVVAYLLSVGGRLVLHASAVEFAGGAVAFVGHSGQGKTTLAALCCAAGCPLVTDDLLPVTTDGTGQAMCVPAGIELRLRPDATALLPYFSAEVSPKTTADGRQGIRPALTRAKRLPLLAVVLPHFDGSSGGYRARRLSVPEAVTTLSAHQRIGAWRPATELRQRFTLICEVLKTVPVMALDLPLAPPWSQRMASQVLASLSGYISAAPW